MVYFFCRKSSNSKDKLRHLRVPHYEMGNPIQTACQM